MTEAVLDHNEAMEQQSAGTLLSQAREANSLTAKDVADRLFLTPAFIELIDIDEAHKIPKQAFVKGYLRSYAKMVGLDGDFIVRQFDKASAFPTGKVKIRALTEESVGSIKFTGPVFTTGLIGLGALILVVMMVWYFSSSEEEVPRPVATVPNTFEQGGVEQAETEDPIELLIEQAAEPETQGFDYLAPTSDDASNAAANTSERAEGVREEVTQEAIEPEQDSSQSFGQNAALQATFEEAGEPEINLATESEDEGIEVQRVTEDGRNFITVDAGGVDELKFNFSGECWLEIEDANGRAIYGDLGVAGNSLTVYGEAPFRLLFGNAPAIEMSFNGQAFDLTRYTTDQQTAKIRVGG